MYLLLFLLLGGAGAAAYFSEIVPGLPMPSDGTSAQTASGPAPHTPTPVLAAAPVFLDLPDILTNLKTTGDHPVFLRVAVSLELHRTEDREAVDRLRRRIADSLQIYLRELTVGDLNGTTGQHRLREELRRRVNAVLHPVQVKDILLPALVVAP